LEEPGVIDTKSDQTKKTNSINGWRMFIYRTDHIQ